MTVISTKADSVKDDGKGFFCASANRAYVNGAFAEPRRFFAIIIDDRVSKD